MPYFFYLGVLAIFGPVSALAAWPNYSVHPSKVPYAQSASVPENTHQPNAMPVAIQRCKTWQQSYDAAGLPVPGTAAEQSQGRKCRELDLSN